MDFSSLHVRGQLLPCLFLGFGPINPNASINEGDGEVISRAWSSAIEKIKPSKEIIVPREAQDFFGIFNIMHDLNHPSQGFHSFWRHLENTPAFISMIQPAFDALAIETSCFMAPESRAPKRSI
jgi:hypothetical protein